VIRLWLEPAHEQSLRASLTAVDFLSDAKQQAAAASADELVDIVRRWVEELARSWS